MGSLCFDPIVKAGHLLQYTWQRVGRTWPKCPQTTLVVTVPPASSGETVMSCCSMWAYKNQDILWKFSDVKTFSVSDKLLRFPTFTLEEPCISRKETHAVHTGTAKRRETTDSTGGSFSKRLTWLGSEIKLPLYQRRKVATGSPLS